MNDIDFLPADYICVRITRSNNNWLRGLFVVVLGLMVVGWMAQRHSHGKLVAQKGKLRNQMETLAAQLGSPDSLRRELNVFESEGRLLDVLKLNAPPSRWLSGIVQALPTQVTLREISTKMEEVADPSVRSPANRSGSKPAEEPTGDPLERDLERLSKLAERQVLVISLNGTAEDDLAVSSFLNALQRTGLFERVQLLYTDQSGQGVQTQRAFGLRLRVRPVPGRASYARPGSSDQPRPAITRSTTDQRRAALSAPVFKRLSENFSPLPVAGEGRGSKRTGSKSVKRLA